MTEHVKRNPIIILVTTSSPDEAEHIAQVLVEERLAACVQTGLPIQSFFWWENAVQHEPEQLLLIKSTQDKFEELSERVQALHSYDVPEIIALPIVDGSPAYLDWLKQETAPK